MVVYGTHSRLFISDRLSCLSCNPKCQRRRSYTASAKRPPATLDLILEKQFAHRANSLPWIVLHDLNHARGEAMPALREKNVT